ncbi:MAG: hypothetical protein ACLTBA_17640 [Roseburia intestinalis]
MRQQPGCTGIWWERKKGFLLESYDKNYDRYTFFGVEPEEIISSKGQSLVITKKDGTEDVREGKSAYIIKRIL